jgi:hypothetical protein
MQTRKRSRESTFDKESSQELRQEVDIKPILADVEQSPLWQEMKDTNQNLGSQPALHHSNILKQLHIFLKSKYNIQHNMCQNTPSVYEGTFGLFGHVPHKVDSLGKKPQPPLTSDPQDGCYQWSVDGQVDYDHLPKSEKWTLLEIFGLRAIWTSVTEATLRLSSSFTRNFSPNDYIPFDAPQTIGYELHQKDILWDDDVAFGLQRFQGTNPAHVCYIPSATTYVIDYSVLNQFELNDTTTSFKPTCTLNSNLIPQSIDLGTDLPPFTIEKTWKWRYAKLVIGCAEFTHHELINHLSWCHLVTEIFIMATMQTFDKGDLIYQLVTPHFARTLAVNQGARTLLIPWIQRHLSIFSAQGVESVLSHAIAHFDCKTLDFEQSLILRGFDPLHLPENYYYASDGLKVWHCLFEFVTKMVNEKQLDWQRIAMWSELISNKIPSFPIIKEQSKQDELCRIIAGIIFNASVQHSAVNDPQYYFFGFPPNAIPKLLKPIPFQKDTLLWRDEDWKKLYFDSLPCPEVMYLQRDLVSLLALGPPENSSLMNCMYEYRSHFSHSEFALRVVNQLESNLQKISNEIQKRNIYTWLDPMHLTRSVIR